MSSAASASAMRNAVSSSWRAANERVDQTVAAARARATAASTSTAVMIGTLPIDSPVAGRANVLIAPDLEAGNMLAKSLTFLANADAAGIVLGARVPIILTSRADAVMTRLASCGVAACVAKWRRERYAKGA